MEDTCARAVSAIEDLGDGGLGRTRSLLLKRHALRCGTCGSYLKRMEAVFDALCELDRVSAPGDLVEAVMTCLLSGVREEFAAETRGRNVFLYAGAAAFGIAVAVAVGVARWVAGREHDERLAAVGSA